MRRKRPSCFPTSGLRPGLATLLALTALALAARAQAAPPPAADIEAAIIANFERDQQALVTFEHHEHVVTVKDGERDARTLRVWYVNGHAVSETIALDDRTLSPAELAAEHQRALDRARAAAQRPPAPTGVIEFQGHTYPFARLAHDYVYTNPQTRQWMGRTFWVYQATPNPAVSSRSREESLLLRSSGEVWVDAEDQHAVRVMVHTTKPVRYGLGVLATIHQAALDLTLERQAPGLWLPAHAAFSVNATVLLFDSLHRAKTQDFSDYIPLR